MNKLTTIILTSLVNLHLSGYLVGAVLSTQANPPQRETLDLSGSGWFLWRDVQATWKDDKLFLPPVNLVEVPCSPPTGSSVTCCITQVRRMPTQNPEAAKCYILLTEI